MGEVFLARLEREQGFAKLLVLKIVRPELSGAERFQKWFAAEARLSAALSHPNIVQVIDFGRKQEKHFLVMEYVDGSDLFLLLEKAGAKGLRPPLEFVLAVGLAISRALDFAHGRSPGLVHGDVNPQNVLIGRQGEVKLADFGLAALSHPGESGEARVVGKLGYLSPEVAEGRAPSPASDIFGLGAVLYHAACGVPPYPAAESFSAGLAMCRRCQIEPPASLRPDLQPALCRIIERCLLPAPEERFLSAAELEEALSRLASALGADTGPRTVADFLHLVIGGEGAGPNLSETFQTAVPATVVASPQIAKRRRRLGLGLGGLAAVVGISVWLGWPSSEAPPAERVPPAAPARFRVKAPTEEEALPVRRPAESLPPRPEPKERHKSERAPKAEKLARVVSPPAAEQKEEQPAPAPPMLGPAMNEAEEMAFILRTEGQVTLSVDGETAGDGIFSSREPPTSPRVFQLRGADGLQATLRLEPAVGQKGLLLAVHSRPFAIFSLDGKPRGLTPLAGLALPPGSHTMTIAAKDGIPVQIHVEFRSE